MIKLENTMSTFRKISRVLNVGSPNNKKHIGHLCICFLPNVVNKIDKLLKGFICCQDKLTYGKAKVA